MYYILVVETSIILLKFLCIFSITRTHVYFHKFSATSPGKLLQYLVEDGSHIDAKQPYAEIEVCIAHYSLCAEKLCSGPT